ncbi:MAG: hypothetical protein GX642_04635 [Smithella sp.]|nr:hypothetical protein [Smithella sp.]
MKSKKSESGLAELFLDYKTDKTLATPERIFMASVMLFTCAGLMDGRTMFQVNGISEISRNWTLSVK